VPPDCQNKDVQFNSDGRTSVHSVGSMLPLENRAYSSPHHVFQRRMVAIHLHHHYVKYINQLYWLFCIFLLATFHFIVAGTLHDTERAVILMSAGTTAALHLDATL